MIVIPDCDTMFGFPVYWSNLNVFGVIDPLENDPLWFNVWFSHTIAYHIFPSHACQSFDRSCHAELSFGGSHPAATHPCVM